MPVRTISQFQDNQYACNAGALEPHKLIVLLELEGGNAQISGRGTREPQQIIVMLIPKLSYAHLGCFQ